LNYNKYSREELIQLLDDRNHTLEKLDVTMFDDNENEQHKILDYMPDMILLIDSDFQIVWANKFACENNSEMIGKHCSESQELCMECINDCLCEKAFESGKQQTKVFKTIEDNGDIKYWHNTVIPVLDSHHYVHQLIIVKRDITEYETVKLKNQEYNEELLNVRDQVDIANQAKSDFLSNTSHEIRTPMNGIMGMIQLLETTELDVKQKEFMDYLKASSDRLLGVVDNILDISKLDKGKYNLIEEEFDIRNFVKDTFNIKEKTAINKGLSLDYKISSKVPTKLIADKYRLSQMLSNIIENSIKFSKVGHIDINVDAELKSNNNIITTLRISDTGIGIPEDKLNKIFDQFNQVDNSSTREYNGTGLGLSITKHLVELMGGTIEVHSTYGVGTTFYLRIPMKISEFESLDFQNRMTHEETEEIPQGDNIKSIKKILIAEDEMLGRITIKLMLKDRYKVFFAKNGKKAVEKYFEVKPDLVLMDIMMPIMNGFEAFDEIEKNTTNRAPIIACTAKVIKTEKEYLMSYGFDDYLSKPIDMKKLHSIIEKHLLN